LEQGRRPIGQHLDEFVDHVAARGRDARYVQQIRARLEKFIRFGSITRLDGVTAERVDAFILSLRASGMSGFTINEYITGLKAFTKWAVTTSRVLTDPLAAVRKGDGRAIR